jgi:hypothetical protein
MKAAKLLIQGSGTNFVFLIQKLDCILKSSLASATSLIALLALQPGQAFATTISLSPDPYSFGNVYFGAGAVTPTAGILASVNNTAGSTQTFSLSGISTSGFSGASVSAPVAPSTSVTATVTYSFAPTVTGAASATATLSGGGVASKVLTLTGTGVAPVAGLAGGSAGNVLVGQSGTLTVTATNTGNGNLATNVSTSISNLNGTIGSASGGLFTGGGGSVSINDGKSAVTTYTFAPTMAGAASTTVTDAFTNGGSLRDGAASLIASLIGTGVAPVNSVTTTTTPYVRVGTSATATVVITNTGNGNLATNVPTSVSNLNASLSTYVSSGFTGNGSNPTSISLNDSKTSTLSYTYTPLSRGTSSAAVTASFTDGSSAGTNKAQTVTATVSSTGVGAVYQSVYKGATITPTAVAAGATATTGPTISLGTLGLNSALTSYLTLNNTSTDPNGGQTQLTNLTIKGYSLSGANPNDFQVSIAPGTVLGEGGTLSVPITVTGNTSGIETASLTIFTDESMAYGGVGDTFTYILTASVPEPATIATFGAGLAGLAFMRRRRKLPSG